LAQQQMAVQQMAVTQQQIVAQQMAAQQLAQQQLLQQQSMVAQMGIMPGQPHMMSQQQMQWAPQQFIQTNPFAMSGQPNNPFT